MFPLSGDSHHPGRGREHGCDREHHREEGPRRHGDKHGYGDCVGQHGGGRHGGGRRGDGAADGGGRRAQRRPHPRDDPQHDGPVIWGHGAIAWPQGHAARRNTLTHTRTDTFTHSHTPLFLHSLLLLSFVNPPQSPDHSQSIRRLSPKVPTPKAPLPPARLLDLTLHLRL